MNMNKAIVVLFGSFVISLLSSNPVFAGTLGLQAFKENVHPIVSVRCVSCHGNGQPPQFAIPVVADAYKNAMAGKILDTSVLTQSKIWKRHQNGHCGEPCNPNAKTKATMEAALTAWFKAEGKDLAAVDNGRPKPPGATVDGPGISTAPTKRITARVFPTVNLPDSLVSNKPMALPNGGETKVGFQVLRFYLPQVNDIYLELQVQRFGDTYRIRAPKVGTKSQPVRIKGIHVALNADATGTPDPKFDHFAKVDWIAQPIADAWTSDTPVEQPDLPSAYPMLSIQEIKIPVLNLGSDRLTVSIDSLERLPASDRQTACKALAAFREDVLPLLTARNCYECHGGGSNAFKGIPKANATFPMTGSEETLCEAFAARVRWRDLNSSPIPRAPLGQTSFHPRVIESDELYDITLRSWLRAEAEARPGLINELANPSNGANNSQTNSAGGIK